MSSTPAEPGHGETAPDGPTPPVTGHAGIDAALAAVELGDDVHTHHDVLATALEAVQHALNPPRQPPLPRP
ncbi:MAG: hypothetical protein QM708_15365 [Propioniciclava sp.]|uniref:hypothetical protein n=1 Tax=Propioniciclava sp. TaxID=2038686 RepID=UPI0039E6B2AB